MDKFKELLLLYRNMNQQQQKEFLEAARKLHNQQATNSSLPKA